MWKWPAHLLVISHLVVACNLFAWIFILPSFKQCNLLRKAPKFHSLAKSFYFLCNVSLILWVGVGINNHLTALVPGTKDKFLVFPFGLLWSEVTASSLLVVDEEGKVLKGKGAAEATAFYIHRVRPLKFGHQASWRNKNFFPKIYQLLTMCFGVATSSKNDSKKSFFAKFD